MKEKLRSVNFRPYRRGMGPTFRLTTYDIGKTDSMGKNKVGYRLDQIEGKDRKVVFEGEDFACSPLHSIDSDRCIAAIMGFLTLRPGDTDSEYFEGYTDDQLAFANEHAEALGMAVIDRFGED